MIKILPKKFVILGKSEILDGKFVPTAHGEFDSVSEAYVHAMANMKETPFKVVSVEQE